MNEIPTTDDLPQDVEVLKSPETGATTHISEKSADDVDKLISTLKPDTVMIELCKSRISLLNVNQTSSEKLSLSEVSSMYKNQGGMSVLLNYLYSNVTQQIKVVPGEEFRRASQSAQKIGAKIILGDRPVHITLKRTWSSLSLYEKLKLFYYVIIQSNSAISAADIEEMKNSDVLTQMVKEFSTEFPSLARTLIDERDIYMAFVLRKCVGNKIVAVVGKGHVNGIKANFSKQLPNIAPIMEIQQKPSMWKKMFKMVLVVAITSVSARFLIKRLK